jgi:uncharacterized protein YbjT (DUF2867 family)
MPTALILGSTGLVGRHLVDVLRAEPRYEHITVVTRRASEAFDRDAKTTQVVVDFARLADYADRLAADHVFCALGTTMRTAGSKERFRDVDYAYPVEAGRVTLANGAKHFSLVSSLGANAQSRTFYSRVKGETEEAIRSQGWPSLVIVRPSIIGGEREERRPGERLGQVIFRLLPKSLRTIPARVIALAMVELAKSEPPGVKLVPSRDLWAHAR